MTNFTEASKAREYIEEFKREYYPTMTWVQFGNEKVQFEGMDDATAIRVANGLLQIEAEGTKNRPRQ